MQRTDLVYVLGNGSPWNNNELRFSLRSVHENLSGAGRIYIIGHDPGFLSEKVIFIPFPDNLENNADGNMALKILRACEEPGLSEEFLFMNDDFIINRPVTAGEIPWLHKGDMKERPESFWKRDIYRSRLYRTYSVLEQRKLSTIQFDYHAPMRMDKNRFPEVMSQFSFINGIGYTFRSLYGNCMRLPAIPADGMKITIYKFFSLDELYQRIQNIPFIGYNDNGLNHCFKWWMVKNYPTLSPYESNMPRDRYIDLYHWKENNMDYTTGVEIFERYLHQRNLLKLFKRGKTELLHRKLNYKLEKLIGEL